MKALAGLTLGLLPGLTLVEWAFGEEFGSRVSDDGETGLCALALLGMESGYRLLVLGTLLAHYLPRLLSQGVILALTHGLSLLFFALRIRAPGRVAC